MFILVSFVKILLVDKMMLGNVDSLAEIAVVCVTLALTVVFAKIVGCIMPILAKKLGFDPAVMASPFITTVVDAFSLIIYFAVASFILGI